MANILKEILERLPSKVISEANFEGANIVLYTKDREFFKDNREDIRKIVNEFKKRVEVRADPAITMDPDNTKKAIKKILPKDVDISDIIFDAQRSRLIIHVDKPGMVIGKQGELLKKIKEKTLWTPIVKRIPPIRSKIIEKTRATLYENSDYRRKFLDKVGHRIYDGWLRGKKQEWIRLTFLGGARQVGRSCMYLQTPESRILLDCGIDVAASDEDAYPFLEAPEFNINDLDAVIISHSHVDHSGLIPYLFKYGYEGPIYCTAPTRDVMALLQMDMIKIQAGEGKNPIYGTEDIKKMVMHTICVGWDEVTDVTPDVRLTFFNSGHILGSSMVHLNIGNGFHNLLYTGDLKYGRTNLLEGANNKFARMESMIIESTYGGKESQVKTQKEIDDEFVDTVSKTIKRKGKILMPVLGSGRAQEILIILHNLIKKKKIPAIPIYIDGMVWDITAIHTAYPEFLNRNIRRQIFHKDENPFLMSNIKKVGSHKERLALADHEEPCIILATSGMLTGGPSVQYLKMFGENKKNTLIFSCYQAQNSLGRRIQQGERAITFKENGNFTTYNLNLEVAKVTVKGHSDRRELMNFVTKSVPRPRKVIVQHGEQGSVNELASKIYKTMKVETISPKNLETIRLR